MPPLTEEQIRAINSIGEHVLVSAGAGSGKTFVLVERYIQVLAEDEEASINDIIAVTFTRKAAEEMRSRLKARLKELAGQFKDESQQKQERWIKCLAQVESARIGTIHSLCESILKNYPAEAGIDPAFEILDDLERAELLAESIDAALHSVIEKPLEIFGDLLDRPIEELRKWISDFLRSPLKYKESRNRFGGYSLESLQSFAERFIEEDIKQTLLALSANNELKANYLYLKNTPVADPESKIAELQSEILSYLEVLFGSSIGLENVKERFEALQSLASMPPARTTGGQAAKELRDSMRILRNEARSLVDKHQPELNDADKLSFSLIRALLLLTDDAIARYESLKRQHQKLDFDDLIGRCHLLLADKSGAVTQPSSARKNNSGFALRQVSKNLRAVLVDEFQDTNWTQAGLLTALASARAKLFLIGDDKQSIYKFQGADVGTFNTCKTFISSLSSPAAEGGSEFIARNFGLPKLDGTGQLMTLSQSFRSHPQIVNFVNHLFARLFDSGGGAEEFRSRFQALRPARSSDENETPRIDILYTPTLDEEQAESNSGLDQIEAALTASWIKEKIVQAPLIFDKEQKLDRPLKYSDFAILLQANSDFAAIEKALAQESIPFVSIAGSGFLDRQEILDLENLLKWLVCPQDSHALFAVLRSPIFGFSDDILHELKAGKDASLWQCLNQKANEEDQEDLHRARRLLQNLQRDSASVSLPELIRKVIQTTSYDVILLSLPTGKQKSRNLFKFLTLACQYKYMSIAEFLKSLNSMRELGVKNLTDAPLSADNAVKIMTIHKSKGLEFAAVALPKLGRSVHQKPSKLLFGKDLSITLDCTRDKEEQKPAFFMAANNLSRRMDEEEKKRLLYVALTRARDYLGIFITPRSKQGTNFGKWLIEALELPFPDGLIDAHEMTAGFDAEQCNWIVSQAALDNDGRLLFPGKDRQDGTIVDSDAHFEVAEIDTIAGFGSSDTNIDFTLMEANHEGEQSFVPVPWQALLRACPAEAVPTVHATIAGNYFHLLMSNLGPELKLPSEDQRRALLSSHEVSVHDHAQQELLIQESERLLITFKNSRLYPLMQNARRRIEESAYLMVRDDEKDEELRPDLIIEDKDGCWHIIDYKTDHVEARNLAKQVAQHQAQLSRYAADLATLLGVKAKAWIYFAQLGRMEPVDLTSPLQLSLF